MIGTQKDQFDKLVKEQKAKEASIGNRDWTKKEFAEIMALEDAIQHLLQSELGEFYQYHTGSVGEHLKESSQTFEDWCIGQKINTKNL